MSAAATWALCAMWFAIGIIWGIAGTLLVVGP